MCGKKLRICSIVSAKPCKVLLVSLFVLCLALQSLAAWPTRSARTEDASQKEPISEVKGILIQQDLEVEESQYQTSLPKIQSTNSSEINSDELIQHVKRLQDNLNSSKKVTDEIKLSVDKLAADLKTFIELEQVEDALAKENSDKLEEIAHENRVFSARNTELEVENSNLAEALDKEQSSKFFANVGGAIGFDGLMPTWGVTGNIGMRLGSGLLIGTGITYMLGNFKTPLNLGLSLDNLSVNATIGWEW